MQRVLWLVVGLMVLMMGTVDAGRGSMAPFLGEWQVDFDRTMEAVKQSPEFSPQDAERMPAIVKRMMGTMRIKLTERDMVYVRGSKEMALPYTVKTASKQAATLHFSHHGKSFEVQFALQGDDHMSFKSSATDDMDYYVWKRVEG